MIKIVLGFFFFKRKCNYKFIFKHFTWKILPFTRMCVDSSGLRGAGVFLSDLARNTVELEDCTSEDICSLSTYYSYGYSGAIIFPLSHYFSS